MAEQTKKRRLGWIIGGLVLVLIVAGLFFWRSQQGQVATAEATETAVAFIGDLSSQATASGQVEAGHTASLAASNPGIVEQVHVRVGDRVQPGERLVRLETDSLMLSVAQAEQAIAIAQASLDGLVAEPFATDVAAAAAAVASAQASLDNLLAGPTVSDMALYEATVRSSQASLASASASLQTVQNSVQASQLLSAQSALLSAQIAQEEAQERNEDFANEATHEALVAANQALAAAEAAYEALLAGPNEGELGAAQASLAAAAARLDSAEADFVLNTQAATAAQLAQVQQQLAQAQAQLAALVDGPTVEEVVQAEAVLAQAELTLGEAEAALAQATVVAPFGGMVTAVYVSEGEYATGTVVELVDTASLELVLSVDEVDIGELALGQTAEVTLETWPEVVLASAIDAIAPTASEDGSGLITYDVHLGLAQAELPILVGMTANAQLTTANREGVLLVPNGAVTADRQAGTYTVEVIMRDAEGRLQAEPRLVAVGLRDSQYTQILDGLAAGDEVLIGTLSVSEAGFSGPFGRGG